jgi:hypothetical protein
LLVENNSIPGGGVGTGTGTGTGVGVGVHAPQLANEGNPAASTNEVEVVGDGFP